MAHCRHTLPALDALPRGTDQQEQDTDVDDHEREKCWPEYPEQRFRMHGAPPTRMDAIVNTIRVLELALRPSPRDPAADERPRHES